MRRDVVLALFLATTSGLFAAVGAYNWMPMRERTLVLKEEGEKMHLSTVVVAKKDLVFGAGITAEQLEEAKWPKENVPEGSYTSITQFFAEQPNRVVLEAVHASEPILRGKVTGPGQRATLSSMLSDGMKAVSIKVNDVVGVGGFVMPGDYVDVLLIVEEREAEDRKKPRNPAYSDLLLERVRVLAIDQSFDPKLEQPKIGSTVTVEVALADAQKIALAQQIGRLSLVLRSTGHLATTGKPRRMLASDLGDNGDKASAATFQPTNAVAEQPPAVPPSTGEEPPRHASAKINVVRSVTSSEYEVVRANPAP